MGGPNPILTMSPKAMGESVSRDEILPLCAEFEDSTVTSGALPRPSATPDEVRDYLSRLLKSKRDLPEDHVRRVVARWQTGTGMALRMYTPSMYLNVFGREDGWIVYWEVRLVLLKQDKKFLLQKYLFYFATAVMLGIEVIALVLAFTFHGVLGIIGAVRGRDCRRSTLSNPAYGVEKA